MSNTPAADEFGDLIADPELTPIVARILSHSVAAEPAAVFTSRALGSLLSPAVDYAAVVNMVGERGTVLGDAGRPVAFPWKWLSEVMAREAPAHQGPWVAVPLESQTSELLALHAPSADSGTAYRLACRVARSFAAALQMVRSRERDHRRAERLETILEIAGHWYQAHEMEPLLVQMAQAAIRLLDSDRASIFLWDRPNRMLVARPALGVPGGELRVADNQGLVGQVVHSGQSLRVDQDRDQQLIDHSVDTRIGYRTRTLLCVPLRTLNDEILGAFEVINKREGNFTEADEQALAELAQHAAIALANTQERSRLLEARRQLSAQAAQGINLVGQSAVIEALRSTIKRVANTDLAILLMGENGTGKEVVSQSVHYLSSRRDHPFVAVNCAALTETLLESELFGHEKGAFTDAHEARAGKFELANGGTLFLDEIGDLSAGGQAKLLRVLEEKVVVRVGGSKAIPTDARVIAATNQDLAQMVREKRFRQDLYYRLNVVTLKLPPLRERPDDIWLLAEHFLNDFCVKARRRVPRFSAPARRVLESHTWPGNVRELRNLMERIAYLVSGDEIAVEDLSLVPAPGAAGATSVAADLPLTEATTCFQTEYIQQAIDRAGGNMSRAAEQLGLHRSNLYRKMRQLGMHVVE